MADITLSGNATIAADAAQGTVIGTFSVPVQLQLQTDPGGYFLVSGQNLIVEWAGQAIPGSYDIQVHAPGSGKPQHFTITITQPSTTPPPTPVPTPPPIPTPTPTPPPVPCHQPRGQLGGGDGECRGVEHGRLHRPERADGRGVPL